MGFLSLEVDWNNPEVRPEEESYCLITYDCGTQVVLPSLYVNGQFFPYNHQFNPFNIKFVKAWVPFPSPAMV